ncbi:peptidoglycan-binding protein LysM [Hydromonas duriensis]|uniref:Potassium binding protein Kbp n=1 Tax=Hydromonas duriensis TaxID=1527608 RepID=A0A4R6YA62_9BURK|nr:peptidoglycan-binding protein LysM [Hydromonas duriensis]TDR32388.1 BON domain-containing protein [Hydromonas duriensis]
MGMFSFLKDAGQKLFGGKHEEQMAQDPNAANQAASQAILDYITSMGLSANNLSVAFDGSTAIATVSGDAASQEDKEKILLCAGNVQGVASVNDNMTCPAAEEPQFYMVQSGDTLSKISKEVYGDANKYNVIFEANRPMLGHPDKIYPGQNLRIPKLA